MAVAAGGSASEVSINGSIFDIESEADLGIVLDRYEKTPGVSGGGKLYFENKRIPQKVSGVTILVADGESTHETLVAYAESGELLDLTFGLFGGIVYMGQGQIVGVLERKTMKPTIDLEFALINMKKQ